MRHPIKTRISAAAHHRNGVSGAPFDVFIFNDGTGKKVGILFEEKGCCAVLDIAKLAQGDIAFGSNSYRGDDYEPALREAAQKMEAL